MKPILVIRHSPLDDTSLITASLQAQAATADILNFWENPNLGPAESFSGIISLCGSMTLGQSLTTARSGEVAFLKEALRVQIPILGICAGARALALAAGGKEVSCAKEVGWFPVHTTSALGADLIFKSCPNHFFAFQWHANSFEPSGEQLPLGSTIGCANQMFRFTDNAWAVQFHPEMSGASLEQWVKAGLDEQQIDVVTGGRILDWGPLYLDSSQSLGRLIFKNFSAAAARVKT